jgi:sporulation related protein/tetratricopeptide repeat protein
LKPYILAAVLLVTAAPLAGQTDARLRAAVQLAAEGQSDSARATVSRLLAQTPTSDPLYPQVLYTQGTIARTAAEMQAAFRRVAVEFPVSEWSDDALLRLAQMDYATRDYAAATRSLDQLRANNPSSELMPVASYWAARSYFDLNKPADACAWINRGLQTAGDDIEMKNQLTFLAARCDAPGLDQVSPPQDIGGSAGQGVGAHQGAPVPGGAFAVQVASVSKESSANDLGARLAEAGYRSSVVRDGNVFKVRVMGFPSRAAADTAVIRIRDKFGGSPFVVAP